MLQLPVVVGQMMDYYYFSTDEQIFFLNFSLYFAIMFRCKH